MKNKIDYIKIPSDEEGLPRISLIVPFDPKMRSQLGLFNLLTAAADKTERELMVNYPEEKVKPVIKKLRRLITNMVCRPLEKSIGIFVSPLTEKVYYFTPTSFSKNYFLPVLIQRDNRQISYLKKNYAN
jgi:hypothetical protein